MRVLGMATPFPPNAQQAQQAQHAQHPPEVRLSAVVCHLEDAELAQVLLQRAGAQRRAGQAKQAGSLAQPSAGRQREGQARGQAGRSGRPQPPIHPPNRPPAPHRCPSIRLSCFRQDLGCSSARCGCTGCGTRRCRQSAAEAYRGIIDKKVNGVQGMQASWQAQGNTSRVQYNTRPVPIPAHLLRYGAGQIHTM